MLDFDNYDKFKEARIVPEHIRKMFEDDGEFGKVLIEMCVPAISVVIHATTHEPLLFSDLLEKMKKAKKLPPYFHGRMPYKDRYRSLSLLGKECLGCLLSELDCSDSVFNDLRDSVIDKDSDAFEKAMRRWDGSFSEVTPLCWMLSLELFIKEVVEWCIEEGNRIDKITDLDQQNQECEAFVRKLDYVIAIKIKDVTNDELDVLVVKTFDEILNEANLNDVLYTSSQEAFAMGVLAVAPNAKIELVKKAPKDFFYKMLLIAYHFLATETSISKPAKSVIKEILFVPEYEAIWKQYEDSDSIDYLIEEFGLIVGMQQTPQIKEPAAEEEKYNPIPRKTAQQTDDDSETQDFRDATIEEKVKELKIAINELLDKIEGREHEFWDDDDNCNLNDIRGVFRDILTTDAGENINTQRAIIDELSGNKRVSLQSRYYYKRRLWVQPFFIILGHLYNKGVWKGDQLSFVKALFPDMHDESPVYGEVYKYDKEFINTCRAKVSLGNTTLFKEPEDSKKLNDKWKTWFEWIDTFL